MCKTNFGRPADRSLEAAGPQAAADAAVSADQNLFSVSVVGKGVFALEGHRLGKKKRQSGIIIQSASRGPQHLKPQRLRGRNNRDR